MSEWVRSRGHNHANILTKRGVSIIFYSLPDLIVVVLNLGGRNWAVEKTSAWIKIYNISLFGRFLGNSRPAWSFVYYSKVIFWKTNVQGSSEVFPALLVCKMAIFALLGVFPFSYLPHILEIVEANETIIATRHFVNVLFALFTLSAHAPESI